MTKLGTCLIVAGTAVCSACVADNPDYDPTFGHKRIFVTANKYLGGEPSSSIRPGQKICDESALAAGLGGRWIPWLSYHIIYPVPAIEEIKDVGPWYDLNGALIFANKAALTQAPAAPLRITELQTELATAEPIWTGTRTDGTRGDNLCFSQLPYRVWYSESSDSTGEIGEVGSTDIRWTQAGALPCNESAHIICLEQ